jgi:hypothetical protein
MHCHVSTKCQLNYPVFTGARWPLHVAMSTTKICEKNLVTKILLCDLQTAAWPGRGCRPLRTCAQPFKSPLHDPPSNCSTVPKKQKTMSQKNVKLQLWPTKYRRNRVNFASFVRPAMLILLPFFYSSVFYLRDT